MTTRSSVFLDTGYAVALILARDEHHGSALRLARDLDTGRPAIVTTTAVVFEIASALAREPYRQSAIKFIEYLHGNPGVSLTTVNESLYAAGFGMFVDHADKSWTLVDCISFVVMRERGISDALTADRHFVQAGFRALLLKDDA